MTAAAEKATSAKPTHHPNLEANAGAKNNFFQDKWISSGISAFNFWKLKSPKCSGHFR